MPVRMPSPQDISLTEKRLKAHAQQYIGKSGVKDIRGRFRANYVVIEVIKESNEGLVGRLFGMGKVKGIGKLARLEFLGPNKWKFFIYSYENQRFESYKSLREGTVEQCLDTAAKVFLS